MKMKLKIKIFLVLISLSLASAVQAQTIAVDSALVSDSVNVGRRKWNTSIFLLRDSVVSIEGINLSSVGRNIYSAESGMNFQFNSLDSNQFVAPVSNLISFKPVGDGDTLIVGMATQLYVLDFERDNTRRWGIDSVGYFQGAGIDAIGAGGITIGSADVLTVNVTTDGTGDGELTLPDGSIGSSELIDDVTFTSVATATISAVADADTFKVNLGTQLYPLDLEVNNTSVFRIDSLGNATATNFIGSSISAGFLVLAEDTDSIMNSVVYADADAIGIGTTTPLTTATIHSVRDGQNLVTLDAFGAAASLFPGVVGRRAGGSQSVPDSTEASTHLFQIQGRGYDGSAYTSKSGAINISAVSEFTNANWETEISFEVTPSGSTTPTARMWLRDNGLHVRKGASASFSSENVIYVSVPVDTDGRIISETYGTGQPKFTGHHAGGTEGSPSATTAGSGLAVLDGRGTENGTAFESGGKVTIGALQTWSNGNHGSAVRMTAIRVGTETTDQESYVFMLDSISVEGATENSFQTFLAFTDPTKDNRMAVPDTSGTFVLVTGTPTTGQILVYNTSGVDSWQPVNPPLLTGTMTIPDPVANDSLFAFGPWAHAVTIDSVKAYLDGAGGVDTDTVNVNMRFSTSYSTAGPNGAGTAIFSANQAVDNFTTGERLSTFADATIPADNILCVNVTSKGGTVTKLVVIIYYHKDL